MSMMRSNYPTPGDSRIDSKGAWGVSAAACNPSLVRLRPEDTALPLIASSAGSPDAD